MIEEAEAPAESANLPTPASPVPPSSPVAPASDPSPSLNRQAIEADLSAIVAWLETSGRWTSLDRVVTLLTGRSLTQRSSAISWAVTAMSDDELELLVSGVLERAAGYLGVAPPAPPPGAPERAVLGRFLELVRAAPGWAGGAPNPIFARFFGR